MRNRKTKNAFFVGHLKDMPLHDFGRMRMRSLVGAGQIPGTSILHVWLPPYCRHAAIYHRKTREWFLVLRGRGSGLIGSRKVHFKPGVIVYMPPGVPHQMSTGASPLEALVLFTPPINVKDPKADICHPG